MCNNCKGMGCYGCSGRVLSSCGNPCYSLGPFRATSPLCTPQTANTGSIIAFSTGPTNALLEKAAGDTVTTGSLVGFGSVVPGVSILDTITLPVAGIIGTEAFNVPRNGVVTSISASFVETLGVALAVGTTATIRAQLYRAPVGSDTFTATNAFVDLTPTITGPIAIGDTFHGTKNVNLPVRAGERLLMVFSIEVTGGLALAFVLTGPATAGINIA